MANTPTHCYSSLQLCRMRVARLDATGKPLAGDNNLYVTDQAITLGVNLSITTGDKFTQKSGCGVTCVTFQDCDRIDAVDLTLELCVLDHELIEMLTGSRLLVKSGNAVGIEIPANDATCANGVSVEAWTKAWTGNQQASALGSVQWFQWAFPKTTWVMGQFKLENNVLVVPLTGRGLANAQFSDGPGNDWPATISNPMAWFLSSTIPAASCGYQTLAAS